MTFVTPRHLLVTAKTGAVWLVSTDGRKTAVAGVPVATVGGQGGMGDVVPHPDYATNKWIYLSYVESADGGRRRGAVVVRGRLRDLEKPALTDVERLWTQSPKMAGSGHFAHRIVFGPKGGRHAGKMFITSGDRTTRTRKAQEAGTTPWARSSACTMTAGCQSTIHSKTGARWRAVFGPSVTVTPWALPLTAPAGCGPMKWGRPMEMGLNLK